MLQPSEKIEIRWNRAFHNILLSISIKSKSVNFCHHQFPSYRDPFRGWCYLQKNKNKSFSVKLWPSWTKTGIKLSQSISTIVGSDKVILVGPPYNRSVPHPLKLLMQKNRGQIETHKLKQEAQKPRSRMAQKINGWYLNNPPKHS